MKKLLMVLALTSLGFACKASGANVHASNCTGADCADCKTDCTAEEMKDCQDCPSKAEACKGEGEAAVCPVTGKSTN
jgi:hypothetical protein